MGYVIGPPVGIELDSLLTVVIFIYKFVEITGGIQIGTDVFFLIMKQKGI
jgi:hypothetical protein